MEDLVRNLNGHIHDCAGGFFEKYFVTTKWASTAETHAGLLPDLNINSKSSLCDWLRALQSNYSCELGTWQTHSTGLSGRNLQPTEPDFYLIRSSFSTASNKFDWTQVQAIGDIDDGNAEIYRDSFLRLCQQAQQVFISQPTRFFLHGFHIYQDKMTPWVFDRSGIYSGSPIDCREDQNRLKVYLSGYRLMDDADLGINTFVQRDASGQYIVSNQCGSSHSDRLYLEGASLKSASQIVGNGIAVYRAKRSTAGQAIKVITAEEDATEGQVDAKPWELAIKFKWQLPETGPVRWPGEERMLKLVEERNVWGVLRLFNCHRLQSVNELREGLQFKAARKFVNSNERENTSLTEHRSPAQEHQQHPDRSGAMETDISTITQPVSTNVNSKDDANHFTDRILSCVIVSPLGRPLHEFDSITQLLEAIRDAIKGHKDLYKKGILHQDISVGNIMIVEARKAKEDPKGMLVDLDLALDKDNVFPDGRSSVGTPMFMAIEVLNFKRHTYRHDLESFLYVLLWIATCNKSDELPENSPLEKWRGQNNEGQSAEDPIKIKTKDMGLEGFRNIVQKFDPDFQDVKPLAWKLREILFGLKEGEDGPLRTGTDEGEDATDQMYRAMIDGFDELSIRYSQSRP